MVTFGVLGRVLVSSLVGPVGQLLACPCLACSHHPRVCRSSPHPVLQMVRSYTVWCTLLVLLLCLTTTTFIHGESDVLSLDHSSSLTRSHTHTQTDEAAVAVSRVESSVEALPAKLATGIKTRLAKLLTPSANGLPAVAQSTVAISALQKQTYGHGAVMGAALEFAYNSNWLKILQQIDPTAHKGLVQLLLEVRTARNAGIRAKLIGEMVLSMENNPVLAAYGTVEQLLMCSGGSNSNLDPKLCSMPLRVEWDVWTSPTLPSDVTQVRISHGSSTTLMLQSLAKSQPIGWSSSDTKSAPTAVQWLERFGRAINMAKRQPTNNLSTSDLVKFGASFLAAPSGLVLDVKSTYTTSAALDALCAALKRNYGINVFGVGSFVRPQIDGMKGGVPAVHFYHSHYALIADGLSKTLRKGDVVMFNGASMLRQTGSNAYALDTAQLADVAAVQKEWGLRISIYAQEAGLGPSAALALIAMVNQNANVFQDGFAYGHLNGRAERYAIGSGEGSQSPLILVEKLALSSRRAIIKAKGAIFGLFKRSDASSAVAFTPPQPLTQNNLKQADKEVPSTVLAIAQSKADEYYNFIANRLTNGSQSTFKDTFANVGKK